jgi:uncharacterized protein (TIGR03118 family)
MKPAAVFIFKFFAILGCILLISTFAFAQHYTQTNLISDGFINAPLVDPSLVNPWGLTRSASGSPWWISDNNSGFSTVYSFLGTNPPTVTKVLSVTVPVPPKSPAGTTATPTGVVQNSSPDFVISGMGTSAPAAFIFCTEDGTISAWSGATGPVLEVTTPNAVYKGCTSGDVNGKRFLYVANFRSARIEVYDATFTRVGVPDQDADRFSFSEEKFDDDRVPRGFAPFNVQNIGGSLFVTYAKQDEARHDDEAGPGNGYVDIYSPTGKLESRLEHGAWLNSPWGVVWAPRDFGEFSNRVLVGNFGSGQIAAYNGFNGKFIGLMKTFSDPVAQTGESVVVIDGLWSLTFGNSAAGCPATPPAGSGLPTCGKAGPYNSLFFTAGPDMEMHGLFGMLNPIAAEQDGDEE